jgi:putative transposase
VEGFLKRKRKLDVIAFFWTLVLGFGAGTRRDVSSLRRAYERVTGRTWAPSSFYDRFNPELVKFLKAALEHALASFQLAWGLADDLASVFRDVILADATVLKLPFGLRGAFPGCRTNSSPAAAKLHAVLSVRGKGKSTVAITSERTSELGKLRIGPWVKDRLLLFDLGYFRFQLFSRIRRNGGFFVTRLRAGTNPIIVKLHRQVRGNAIDVEGKKLKDVIRRLKREVLDAEVEAVFQRRSYDGRQHSTRERYRFIAIRNPHTGEHHTFVTNVPPDLLSAEAVAASYRARWALELLFAELKTGYRMTHLSSERKVVVEALIYAAILSLVASRKLLQLLTAQDRKARMTVGRWWRLLSMAAQEILMTLLLPARIAGSIMRSLIRTLLHELQDPHRDPCPFLLDALKHQRGYGAA